MSDAAATADSADQGGEGPADNTAQDVPAAVRREFWTAVLVLKGGLLAVSLGAMLIGFRGQWREGGVLMVGGAVLLARAYARARAYGGDADGDAGDDADAEQSDETAGRVGKGFD